MYLDIDGIRWRREDVGGELWRTDDLGDGLMLTVERDGSQWLVMVTSDVGSDEWWLPSMSLHAALREAFLMALE